MTKSNTMKNQKAETVAKTFYTEWISQFGILLQITTDQGRQFESQLQYLSSWPNWRAANIYAYHPQANGLVERFHRQLKAALRCHADDRWMDITHHPPGHPRSLARRPECNNSRTSLRRNFLPGQFLDDLPATNNCILSHVVTRSFSAVTFKGRHEPQRQTAIHLQRLGNGKPCVRHDGPKSILQPLYNGPFQVLSRSEKTIHL